jgi:hypothetical protein
MARDIGVSRERVRQVLKALKLPTRTRVSSPTDPSKTVRCKHTMVTGHRGAASELYAAADLIERGYEVFRAVSPAAKADLLIEKPDGSVERIQVRTGKRHKGINNKGTRLTYDNKGKYDRLAVVIPTEARILYIPPFEDPTATPEPGG